MSLIPVKGDLAEQTARRFFDSLRSIEQGYQDDTLSYVALKQSGILVLIQGRLSKNIVSPVVSEKFETDEIVASRFTISSLNLTAEQIVEAALRGTIPIPEGELIFRPGDTSRYGVNYEAFHPEGLARQQRLSTLRLDGVSTSEFLDITAIDWHLRAAEKPFDGLQDLLFSYDLGGLRQRVNIEVVAGQVAAIDAGSLVDDTTARIGVRLADRLTPEALRLGYRVINNGNTITRSAIAGAKLDWERRPGFQLGSINIPVPASSILQCFASVNGNMQHYYWINDEARSQNPRRAIFEAFDPKLDLLREFLVKQGKGQNARDLETGVSWLLWLLGFSIAPLGLTARTQDFADLVATSPDGNVVVIECTTGLLKAENKLALLIERTELVKRQLRSSNHGHLKVLSVMITSKVRNEVRADLDQAERLGVLIITKEGLDEAVSRTITAPKADILFSEAESLVQSNMLRHSSA